jgi:hypothetical protein
MLSLTVALFEGTSVVDHPSLSEGSSKFVFFLAENFVKHGIENEAKVVKQV